MGQIQTFGPNTIQVMSAGTGVIHSEFNASAQEPGHFLQIWVEPAEEDVEPSYQQISYDPQEKRDRFRLLAAPHGSGHADAALIHQDAYVHAAELGAGQILKQTLALDRHAWVQVARGGVWLNDVALDEGDGAAVSGELDLTFTGPPGGAEFLYFDLK
jgi:redox-sensitive bicupin YhaK (pirin superfamily)